MLSRLTRGLSREVRYEGELKLRTSSLRGPRWRPVHCVLTEAPPSLLLFNIPLRSSQKPLLSLSLIEVHSVERITSSSQPFAFALVPYISSGGVVKLAASSEYVLARWLKKLQMIRDMSDPRLSSFHDDAYDHDSLYSKEINRRPSEGSLPRVINNKNMSTECSNKDLSSPLFVNDLIIFDDISHDNLNEVVNEKDAFMDLFINTTPSTETLVKRNNLSELLCLDDVIINNNSNNNVCQKEDEGCRLKSETYYNAAFFYGTKCESNSILRLKALNGVYLVRIDLFNNRYYLEVLDDFMVLSFEVLYETSGCRLAADVFHFTNITFLIYHYSFNKLPNSCTHLEIPFRLIETI